jgi:hypothetical protein
VRRVLALVAAAGMVVGSLALRARLDRGEEERSTTLRLTCSAELETPCRTIADRAGAGRVALTVEPAGTTADRLAGATGELGLDGWLVPEPWPGIVDGRRRARAMPTLFAENRRAVARSPLVLVVWKERAAALASRCSGPVTWKCLGDAATAGPWTASGGRPEWGSLKPGHAEPASDGVGLLVLGQAVAGWFGRTDVSTFDLDDDSFARWFSALERSVPYSAASPLPLMLAAGPAVYDAAGTTESEAGPLLAQSARRGAVDVLYPAPMATADVVLATTGSESVTSSLRRVATGDDGRRALADGGWRVPGTPNAPGVTDSPALPATTGLPSGGLLDALRARWREVTGR